MKLASIAVRNYKGLRDIAVAWSEFVCVTGHNNAGKSSLLQAISAFFEGKKLSSGNFYDPSQDVAITLRLEQIDELDLELIADADHRQRIRGCLDSGTLTLVRRFQADGPNRLRRLACVPSDERFGEEEVEKLCKGQRAGVPFQARVGDAFPELASAVDNKTSPVRVRELIDELGNGLPHHDKVEQERDLPTGIDASLRAMLPEPIFIAAVKDFGDDVKAKDASTFGKLLALLLGEIAPEFRDMQSILKDLNAKLNRSLDGDGNAEDGRLEAVRRTESTIERFIQESFAGVKAEIQVPLPELKTILAQTRLEIDDGVKGEVESKGDGLKRAVVFAIIRTIAESRRRASAAETGRREAGFILLFEEPELYLHPTAQHILFDALKTLAETDHVVLTTHSPLFFDGDATKTFIKIRKALSVDGAKPAAEAFHIDLDTLEARMAFQIIGFETSNIAFFARTVILVEGASDHVIFPHIARIMNPDWCTRRGEIGIWPIRGKGNIRHYRDFFGRFKVRVIVLADLDCLVEGFKNLAVPQECTVKQQRLIAAIDEQLRVNPLRDSTGAPEGAIEGLGDVGRSGLRKLMSSEDVHKLYNSTVKLTQWQTLSRAYDRAKTLEIPSEEFREAGDAFFSKQIAKTRRTVMEESNIPEIDRLKHELLILLRTFDVFLLSRGAIEKYIPKAVIGGEKTSRAVHFCESIRDRDHVLSLCDKIPIDDSGREDHELAHVFERIFNPTNE